MTLDDGDLALIEIEILEGRGDNAVATLLLGALNELQEEMRLALADKDVEIRRLRSDLEDTNDGVRLCLDCHLCERHK